MKGLSPRTWQLVQKIFPTDAETAGRLLVQRCAQTLPFYDDKDEYDLERIRFAVLKISQGNLTLLEEAIAEANVDWRDVLLRAGFGMQLESYNDWANAMLGGPHGQGRGA